MHLWAIWAKFPHSYQGRKLILSRWPIRPLGPHVLTPRLEGAFFWPSPSPDFCWLPWNLAFPCLLPASQEISRANPFRKPFPLFHAKTDKGIFWLALTYTHTHRNECYLSCHIYIYIYIYMFVCVCVCVCVCVWGRVPLLFSLRSLVNILQESQPRCLFFLQFSFKKFSCSEVVLSSFHFTTICMMTPTSNIPWYLLFLFL